MSTAPDVATLTGVTGTTVRSVMDRPKPGPPGTTIHATAEARPARGDYVPTLCGRTLVVRGVRAGDWPATVTTAPVSTCRRCATLAGTPVTDY